jgi:hypothetical protein
VIFFFIFGLVRFMSAQLALCPPFPLSGVASPPTDVATHAMSCHTSFPRSQDELVASALSSDNDSSHRLLSRAEIKTLNLHHRYRPPSLDCPTFTLHCFKKIILTLTTLSTTQLCIYFVSSLAKALRHWSSIHRCHSLSLMTHFYRPSAQRHPW